MQVSNPLVWKKHVFQYKMLSGLHMPELGLYSSESLAEERLRQLTMLHFGLDESTHRQCLDEYETYLKSEDRHIAQIAKQKGGTRSLFIQASAFLNFFDKAIDEAGVTLTEVHRATLLMGTLVNFGVFYELCSDAVIREVLVLYNNGGGPYDRTIPPYSDWGARALEAGSQVTQDMAIDIYGYARRVIDRAVGSGLDVNVALSVDPMVQSQFSLFQNYLMCIVGIQGIRGVSFAGDQMAREQLRDANRVDRFVLASLDAIVSDHPLPQVDTPLQADVLSTIDRFSRFVPAVCAAWRDGHLDPEERVLSQYGAYHLLGISDVIAARYLRDRLRLEELAKALTARSATAAAKE